jgi:hypothetical protein
MENRFFVGTAQNMKRLKQKLYCLIYLQILS